MEAKFYFDQDEILKMVEESLRRQFPGKVMKVSGYIQDGAVDVTVDFAAGDERDLTPAAK